MERSFSIVQDEDDLNDSLEDEGVQSQDFENTLKRMPTRENLTKTPSAGPSGLRSTDLIKVDFSESDSDPEDDKTKTITLGEYDPKDYDNLVVNPEMKEIFQYITKYIPQPMSLDHKFKPFVPEFLPAVGDIDAFLKVIPPKLTVGGEEFTAIQELGLVVLDEPAANQSDAALLHLQLRAESIKTTHDSDVVVKKVDNVEQNSKIIDKWVKDISALHKSKSFPAVRYTEPMPDLDELMQEWPEEMEIKMKENGFPEPGSSLDEYIEEICGIFEIPAKNKIHALHQLFCLYAAVKSSQLFKNANVDKLNEESLNRTDQLVLE